MVLDQVVQSNYPGAFVTEILNPNIFYIHFSGEEFALSEIDSNRYIRLMSEWRPRKKMSVPDEEHKAFFEFRSPFVLSNVDALRRLILGLPAVRNIHLYGSMLISKSREMLVSAGLEEWVNQQLEAYQTGSDLMVEFSMTPGSCFFEGKFWTKFESGRPAIFELYIHEAYLPPYNLYPAPESFRFNAAIALNRSQVSKIVIPETLLA